MKRARQLLAKNLTPLLFFAVCVVGILWADLSVPNIIRDVIQRVARNLFLVLALIIPVVAGLGLNFSIVLGAMAGQVGLLIALEAGFGAPGATGGGLGGLGIAMLASLPIALVLGVLVGLIMNKARGREMVTGLILGFFANGFYQFFFLILAGPVLPFADPDILLPTGMGLRVTVDMLEIQGSLDSLVAAAPVINKSIYVLPLSTFGASALLCLGLVWFQRTKLGQDLRAVGQDQHIAEVAGIPVGRCRIIAIVLSTVLAGVGQVIWLQNMGTMNTFQSHEQVGFYAIAALLVGGASVSRATVLNAILGTVLFHALITVVSLAGPKALGNSQIGEYFREFFAYAIIAFALGIHAWQRSRARAKAEAEAT